jgi:para-aminobenzoate synthetase/4-amino-4-deoxychorismate lyase
MAIAQDKSPIVILDSVVPDRENYWSYRFRDFREILVFNHGDDANKFFNCLQVWLSRGYWLVGFFSYEFGYYLEPALFSLARQNNFPLAWVGVCRQPQIFSASVKIAEQNKLAPYCLGQIQPNITYKQYADKLKRIKKYLQQGFTYQVNYTFKLKFNFYGQAIALYEDLKRSQPTSYSGFIQTGREQILSLSPELFFRIKQGEIISRPMKGTIALGKGQREKLLACQKIRAENLMIVDLLRNDLGKISLRVWPEKLFYPEKYKTLYQMTSTIKGKLKPNSAIKHIFSALFPCGSVTGAPKIKTMELINQLEKEPRNIYTGAIGWIKPNQDACFNVAIRTLVLSQSKGELGIGGGIVYDSQAKKEYQEALLKAKFFLDNQFPR